MRGNDRGILSRWWQRVEVLYMDPDIRFLDDITLAAGIFSRKGKNMFSRD